MKTELRHPHPDSVLVTPKPARKSRTIWLNAVTVIGAVAAIAGDALDLAAETGIAIPEGVTKYVLLGVGLVNIALRRKTVAPLEGHGPAPANFNR